MFFRKCEQELLHIKFNKMQNNFTKLPLKEINGKLISSYNFLKRKKKKVLPLKVHSVHIVKTTVDCVFRDRLIMILTRYSIPVRDICEII